MSIFSCFSKKKKENLDSWLEQKFPGKYEVLDNHRSLMDRIKYNMKVRAIVGSKEEPEIQFIIDWHKDTAGLGITPEEVEDKFLESKNNIARAREIFQQLNKNDSSKISIGVLEDAAYFLIYMDPEKSTREKYLQEILGMLEAENGHPQTNIFIEFMEDSAYHQKFKDIVPAGYWARIDSYHQLNKTVSLDFEWKQGLSIDTLMHHWTVNTESNRSSVYREKAFVLAQSWAEKNLSKPYYLEPDQMVYYELDQENPMAIHFHFPYFTEKPVEGSEDVEGLRKGFVTGLYDVDKKVFTQIKKETEL